MNPYVILSDSACDIPADLLAAWSVRSVSLTFRFTDEDREYAENDIPSHDFYERMRTGGVAKTSAINTETFKKAFGYDPYCVKIHIKFLFLCFDTSSALVRRQKTEAQDFCLPNR
jgi:fatty acid-binding protein DegV